MSVIIPYDQRCHLLLDPLVHFLLDIFPESGNIARHVPIDGKTLARASGANGSRPAEPREQCLLISLSR